MSLVNVHNEWDPLEEIIVGSALGAQIPRPDLGTFAIQFHAWGSPAAIPSGPFSPRIVQETEAELTLLCEALTSLEVCVRRPTPRDCSATVATPDWQLDGYYDYCPRDSLLAVGNTIIETPMVLRSRFLEQFAYKDILLEYFRSGSRWISAPKPRLLDETYHAAGAPGERLRNLEPCFDAANIIRLGTDLLYLISDSGNSLGAQWLQSTLGPEYKVHACRGIYAHTHVDSTIVPLRPGLVLLNPKRVNEENLPHTLRKWDRIWCPKMVDIGFVGEIPACSVWIGMNLLVIRPGLVVVDRRQQALIAELERWKIEVLPLQLSHSRTLGGGFHCATLDTRRTGILETYC